MRPHGCGDERGHQLREGPPRPRLDLRAQHIDAVPALTHLDRGPCGEITQRPRRLRVVHDLQQPWDRRRSRAGNRSAIKNLRSSLSAERSRSTHALTRPSVLASSAKKLRTSPSTPLIAPASQCQRQVDAGPPGIVKMFSLTITGRTPEFSAASCRRELDWVSLPRPEDADPFELARSRIQT